MERNLVLPSGVPVLLYLPTKPKPALPSGIGPGLYAPAGESMYPLPITNPAEGSQTTIIRRSTSKRVSSSVTFTRTV